MRVLGLCLALLVTASGVSFGASEGQLRLTLRHDPQTFDPHLVEEESGEAIRYLTGGVLIRINRKTQLPEPELASAWKADATGKRVTFKIRKGIRFSDSSPFSAADVAYTYRRIVDPAVKSPLADAFQTGKERLQVLVPDPETIVFVLPAPIAGLERIVDQVAILSSSSAKKEKAGLGPFTLSEYLPGSSLTLARNPHYWKRDKSGRQLPYLQSIRFDIQANRDMEALKFKRGEIHMISNLDAEAYTQLKSDSSQRMIDAGPSFDTEMLWFNQVAQAPIAAYKKEWFRSRAFRKALSQAINRSDIIRLVYRGYAQPLAGPFSSANTVWFNQQVKPDTFSPESATRLLLSDGFRKTGDGLVDKHGNRVALSLITNSGNKARARIASLIQQDLAKVGVKLSVVTLDFPSLIERISRTYAYDACLLGLVNVDPDPNGQMNVWLSSGANHQWNPRQAAPETTWEREIDELMRLQAASLDLKKRRSTFNRVQEIVAEQVPFIYLVSKNSLAAVSPKLMKTDPAALRPQLYWNADQLYFADAGR